MVGRRQLRLSPPADEDLLERRLLRADHPPNYLELSKTANIIEDYTWLRFDIETVKAGGGMEEDGCWQPVELAGTLAATPTSGRYDALTGRWVSPEDDLDDMLR